MSQVNFSSKSSSFNGEIFDEAIKWVMSLGSELGLNFQPSKTMWPAQVIEYLGLIIDSICMEVQLPEFKLKILHSLLDTWSLKTTCTLHEAQQLSSFLHQDVLPSVRD